MSRLVRIVGAVVIAAGLASCVTLNPSQRAQVEAQRTYNSLKGNLINQGGARTYKDRIPGSKPDSEVYGIIFYVPTNGDEARFCVEFPDERERDEALRLIKKGATLQDIADGAERIYAGSGSPLEK